MRKTATLNLRVDEETKSGLARIAKQQDRSPSYIAEQAIKDRIAFEHAQLSAIEKGLAQADKGNLIPNNDVKAWVESWDTDTELPAPQSKA